VAGLRSRLLLVFVFTALSTLLLSGCGARSVSQSTAPTYQVTVSPPATDAGIVTSIPAGVNCPPTCSASFVENTQVKLSATPSDKYFFGGWRGSCSGTSACSLTVFAAEHVTAIFAPAGAGTDVVAYVFTPDGELLKSSEFALLADGQLQVTAFPVQSMLMTGTSHGLVMDLPSASGQSTPTLQSYAVEANGSLRTKGNPVAVAMDLSLNLASDQTYVYAATDEGVFGFVDYSSGLVPLPPIPQTVPPPVSCTPAQENADVCRNTRLLMLCDASAFLLQTSITGPTAPPLYLMSSFVRSDGQLTTEQYFVGSSLSSGIFAPTPNGKFLYALDLASNRVVRYSSNGSDQTNVLSDGQELSDGFVQFIINPDGSFLFGAVSDPAESPRIRVFQINPSSGDLTEVAGSPFLTGEYNLMGVTLDPTGRFLLAVHSGCDGSPPCVGPGKLVAMSVNTLTGALVVTSDVDDGQAPFVVTAVPISD
jgi:hypothetical protein